MKNIFSKATILRTIDSFFNKSPAVEDSKEIERLIKECRVKERINAEDILRINYLNEISDRIGRLDESKYKLLIETYGLGDMAPLQFLDWYVVTSLTLKIAPIDESSQRRFYSKMKELVQRGFKNKIRYEPLSQIA